MTETPTAAAVHGTNGRAELGNGLRIGSLCSGYGGLDLGVQQALGGSIAWHCEIDPHASKILASRWPDVPNLGDLTAVNFDQVQPVDIVTAGFPCQDVSLAGRRAGIAEGTRSGLWLHVARAIRALQPRLVVIENVRGLLSATAHSDMEPCPWCVGDGSDQPALRALGAVLGDLAGLGLDATWACVRASEIGAPHRRERVFVLAWPAGAGGPGLQGRRAGGTTARRGCLAPTDSISVRGDGPRAHRSGRHELAARRIPSADGHRCASPHSPIKRRREGEPEPAVSRRDSDSGEHRRPAAAHAPCKRHRDAGQKGERGVPSSPVPSGAQWGSFRPAIERWERLTGPAPRPTDDHSRLNPEFVEWLMGLDPGHVTGVGGLSRSAQLKALGNGVVPQQAAYAVRMLLDRLGS